MKESQFNIIEDYLTGNMSQEQQDKFLKDIQTDSELYEAFQLQKAEHEAMEILVAQHLKNEMGNWKNSPPPNPFMEESNPRNKIEISKPLLKNKWFIALTLLVIALVSYYFFTKYKNDLSKKEIEQNKFNDEIPVVNTEEENSITPEENVKENIQKDDQNESELYAYATIAEEYYERPDYLTSTLKSKETSLSNTSFGKALDLYRSNKLSSALKELSKSESSNQSNEIFLKANVLFEMKKYAEASTEFEKLTKDELLPIYEDAQWYLLLCYAATLPKSSSKYEKLLSQLLTQTDGFYFNKVKQLSDTVKKQ